MPEGLYPPPPLVSPEQTKRMQDILTAAQRMQELLGSGIVTQAQRSPNFQVPTLPAGHGESMPAFDPYLIDQLMKMYQQTGQYRPLPQQ